MPVHSQRGTGAGENARGTPSPSIVPFLNRIGMHRPVHTAGFFPKESPFPGDAVKGVHTWCCLVSSAAESIGPYLKRKVKPCLTKRAHPLSVPADECLAPGGRAFVIRHAALMSFSLPGVRSTAPVNASSRHPQRDLIRLMLFSLPMTTRTSLSLTVKSPLGTMVNRSGMSSCTAMTWTLNLRGNSS